MSPRFSLNQRQPRGSPTRERQASDAPAPDEFVDDLLIAVLRHSDKPVVVAIELTASRARGTRACRDYFVALARPPFGLVLQAVPHYDSVCVVGADTLGTDTLKDGFVFEFTAGPPLRSSISPRTVAGALAVALPKIVTTIRFQGELS